MSQEQDNKKKDAEQVSDEKELQTTEENKAKSSEEQEAKVEETTQTEENKVESAQTKESKQEAVPTEEKKEVATESKENATPSKAAASETKDDAPAGGATGASDAADAEKEAKRKAAAEARAARAAQRAKKEEEPAEPKPPSPNQPRLDRLVEILKEAAGEEAVEEAFINEHDRDLPVVNVKAEHWLDCAKVLKEHPELRLNYLRNVGGVDYETYFEVVYHFISLETKQDYCIKVKTDHEDPEIPSITSLWNTANWQEREIYDLLGIDFPGHPDLRRIMLPDDWEGHPLRKDYEPIDPEV